MVLLTLPMSISPPCTHLWVPFNLNLRLFRVVLPNGWTEWLRDEYLAGLAQAATNTQEHLSHSCHSPACPGHPQLIATLDFKKLTQIHTDDHFNQFSPQPNREELKRLQRPSFLWPWSQHASVTLINKEHHPVKLACRLQLRCHQWW